MKYCIRSLQNLAYYLFMTTVRSLKFIREGNFPNRRYSRSGMEEFDVNEDYENEYDYEYIQQKLLNI